MDKVLLKSFSGAFVKNLDAKNIFKIPTFAQYFLFLKFKNKILSDYQKYFKFEEMLIN